MRTRSPALCAALLASGALIFANLPANAQDRYDTNASENVEINTPHFGPSHDKLGAPYVLTSLSQPVYFDDLDLRTGRGAHILKQRVRLTARMLCRALDERYPVTADSSPPCYKTALEDAMYQANRAIDDARSYSD